MVPASFSFIVCAPTRPTFVPALPHALVVNNIWSPFIIEKSSHWDGSVILGIKDDAHLPMAALSEPQATFTHHRMDLGTPGFSALGRKARE